MTHADTDATGRPVDAADSVDEVIAVENHAAKEASRRIGRNEGLLVGISAGAAAAAAGEYARENPEETIVAVLPDGGERYLSTDLFPEPDLED